MKKRKILYLFPLVALVLSGCTIQEGLAGAKSFIGNNIYFPVRNLLASLLGKSTVDPTKKDEEQKPAEDQKEDEGKEDEGKEDEGKEDETPVIPETVHAGTEADPLDGADAMTIANALKAGQSTTDSYYIKDKVTKIVKAWEETYGSYTFEIEGGFTGWQLKYGPEKAKFAENDIEVGDTVTMYVQIQMYGSENPMAESKGGYVTKVEKAALDATLTSIEIGGTAKTEYIEGQDYSAEGLTVTANYDGADSRDVTKGVSWSFSKPKAEPEDKSLTITATYSEGGVEKTDSKQVAVNVTAKQDPVHAGTAEDPFDAADVLKVTAGMKAGEKTDKAYYVKGEVKSFVSAFNAEYGDYSFYIEENIEGFSMKNGPEKEKFTGGELEVGDTVTMYGSILNYNGTLELNGRTSDGDAYIVEIVKGEGGGDITPTALTKKVTFEMGADGAASHDDGKSNTAYTETVDDVVLNIKDGTGLGVGARDKLGNGCLKVGTSKAAGSFTLDLTTVTGLDKVVLNIANYKANTGATIVVGDADGVAITGTSDAGVYDAFPINIKDETSLSFSFPKRVMINSIEFWPEEKTVDVESVTINEAGPFTLDRYSENPTKQLSATVLPEDATNKTVTWSVELDENVTEGAITVDSESGLVTGVSKGSGTVYATAGGEKSAGVKFTVVQHLTAFSVTPASQNLTVGDTLTLTKVFTPENANNLEVTFESSDSEVASVSPEGVITAVAAGTATITATASDFATPATCTVTVQNAAIHINGVALDTGSPLAMYIGDAADLEAHVMPVETTDSDKTIEWEVVSDTEEILSLTSAGHVVANKVGTATVRAKSHFNPNAVSEALTIVVSHLDSVTIKSDQDDITEANLEVNETLTLNAVVLPVAAQNKNVVWATDDAEVATVADGVVTAIGEGTAHITATSEADSSKSDSVTINVAAPAAEKGTETNPFTPSELVTYAAQLGLGNNAYSDNEVYVVGYAKTASGDDDYRSYTLVDSLDMPASAGFIVYGVKTGGVAYQNDHFTAKGFIKNHNGNTLELAGNNQHTYPSITSEIVRGTSSISVEAENATVNVISSALNLTEISFTVAADTGYEIVSVKANNDVLVESSGSYSFDLKGNTTIYVETSEIGAVEPVEYKSVSFVKGNCTTATGGYGYTAVYEDNGFEVSCDKFNTNQKDGVPQWDLIKCGHKNTDYVPTITTTSSIDKAIVQMNIEFDAVAAELPEGFYAKVLVSANSDMSDATEYAFTVKANDTVKVKLGSGVANAYYQVLFNCPKLSNGYVAVKSVSYLVIPE